MPSSVLNYYHTINFSIANYMEKEEDAAEYFSAASQISMKTKNRFSILLEHLMSVADLKNSVLAKAVQYDDSYISKWISGKLLPTEKNHEATLQAISNYVVDSLTEDGTTQLLQEYQLQDIQDLKTAIYDNLESEYVYVKELQTTTGAEIAPKISYYPELTLDQFIFKMKHPSLRKVNSLNVYAIVDILNIDPNYQFLIAELNSGHVGRDLIFPGVHFSLLIDLESAASSATYTACFLMNVLTHLSNIDFNLYCGSQAQRKLIFAIKDTYAISGMLVDSSHCLGVSTIEDSELTNELYYKIRLLCNKETLLLRKTTIPEMIHRFEYEQTLISQNQYCLVGHLTEHFLPKDLYIELLDAYCQNNNELRGQDMKKSNHLVHRILETTPIHLLIYASVLKDFTVTGELDFFGVRMCLNLSQRLRCLKNLEYMATQLEHLDIRVLPEGLLSDHQHIAHPTLFLSDSICYLRLKRFTPEYNICIPNKIALNCIFEEFFHDVWNSLADNDNRRNVLSMIKHAIHAVEIMMEIN